VDVQKTSCRWSEVGQWSDDMAGDFAALAGHNVSETISVSILNEGGGRHLLSCVLWKEPSGD
jgi:hypothetical protein